MPDTIADELEGIDLGDERLNKRSKHLLEALAANPEASINAASNGWGDTVAAYRFFGMVQKGSNQGNSRVRERQETDLERPR